MADKFRRERNPPAAKQSSTATPSVGGPPKSSSSSSSTKFTIEQKVSTGAVKKGPYSVKRSVDPNDVLVIKRRLGEGSKPLFARSEIHVNRSSSPKKKPSHRSSSSDSSSPEDRYRRPHVTKRKSVEKVPYFLDQKREKDRIKRVYGSSRRSRSLSRERTRVYARSRTRTPPSYHRRHRSYTDRRSSSRERYRSRIRSNYSRSRSRSRERRRMSHSLKNSSTEDRHIPVPATQFIPIPVPMEYPYIQPAWGAPMMPPQPRFPFVMRPALPAPIAYVPRHFRPPRYPPVRGYQRGNFRPRQY